MKLGSSRLILVLLCAVLAFGAPLSRAFAAEQAPCMPDMSQGSGTSDCDCGNEGAMNCEQHCAALSGGAMIPLLAPSAHAANLIGDAVCVSPPIELKSRAGPPGLQPPR